jgi:hypothetical protein
MPIITLVQIVVSNITLKANHEEEMRGDCWSPGVAGITKEWV